MVAAVLLKIHGLLWSPLHFGCCGLYEVILAMIGPRTTQELISHVQAVNCLLLRVCSGWSSDYVGSRDGGLVFLINLVCLETTQTELEGWISSPQPLNSTGRECMA